MQETERYSGIKYIVYDVGIAVESCSYEICMSAVTLVHYQVYYSIVNVQQFSSVARDTKKFED